MDGSLWYELSKHENTGHVNIDIFKRKNTRKSLNNPNLLVIIQTIFKKGIIVLLPLEKCFIMEAAIFYHKFRTRWIN